MDALDEVILQRRSRLYTTTRFPPGMVINREALFRVPPVPPTRSVKQETAVKKEAVVHTHASTQAQAVSSDMGSQSDPPPSSSDMGTQAQAASSDMGTQSDPPPSSSDMGTQMQPPPSSSDMGTQTSSAGPSSSANDDLSDIDAFPAEIKLLQQRIDNMQTLAAKDQAITRADYTRLQTYASRLARQEALSVKDQSLSQQEYNRLQTYARVINTLQTQLETLSPLVEAKRVSDRLERKRPAKD